MNLMKSVFKNLSAVLLLVTFSLTLIQPFPLLAQVHEDPVLFFFNLEKIPSSYGRVIDQHQGNAGKFVLLIQDAHEIPDAQRSIEKLIEFAGNELGIKTVALEGALQELDATFLGSFPDQKRLREVIEEYYDRGEITGGTAAAIFGAVGSSKLDVGREKGNGLSNSSNFPASPAGGQPLASNYVRFQGIEDWTLYEEGLAFYQKAMAKEPELIESLRAKSQELRAEKEKAYTKEQLEIDEAVEKFYENEASLPELLTLLMKYQRPEQGTELSVLAEEMIRSQSRKDHFEKELREAAQILRREIQAPEVFREFNGKFQAYQTSMLSAEAFGSYLKKQADDYRIQISLSEKLLSGVLHHERLRDLEGTTLMEELEKYLDDVQRTAYGGLREEQKTNDAERSTLYERTKELRLLKKLAKLELSRKEWEEVKKLDVGGWKLDERPEIAFQTLLTSNFQLRTLLQPHLNFYRNSEQREAAFIKNIKELLGLSSSLFDGKTLELRAKNQEPRAAVMVAGGFHTEGMKERLKELGYSYAVVMPKIGKIPETSLYRGHMQGKVSWSNYFEVENGKVSPYKAFVRATRDTLIGRGFETRSRINADPHHSAYSSAYDPLLAKRWRDQILRDLSAQGRIVEASKYTRFLDEKLDVRSWMLDEREGSRSFQPLTSNLQLFQKWYANIDRFIEGYKRLEINGKINRENISALLSASGISSTSVSAANLSRDKIRADLISARFEVREGENSQVSPLTPQELIGQVAEKIKKDEPVTIAFVDDLNRTWSAIAHALTDWTRQQMAKNNLTIVSGGLNHRALIQQVENSEDKKIPMIGEVAVLLRGRIAEDFLLHFKSVPFGPVDLNADLIIVPSRQDREALLLKYPQAAKLEEKIVLFSDFCPDAAELFHDDAAIPFRTDEELEETFAKDSLNERNERVRGYIRSKIWGDDKAEKEKLINGLQKHVVDILFSRAEKRSRASRRDFLLMSLGGLFFGAGGSTTMISEKKPSEPRSPKEAQKWMLEFESQLNIPPLTESVEELTERFFKDSDNEDLLKTLFDYPELDQFGYSDFTELVEAIHEQNPLMQSLTKTIFENSMRELFQNSGFQKIRGLISHMDVVMLDPEKGWQGRSVSFPWQGRQIGVYLVDLEALLEAEEEIPFAPDEIAKDASVRRMIQSLLHESTHEKQRREHLFDQRTLWGIAMAESEAFMIEALAAEALGYSKEFVDGKKFIAATLRGYQTGQPFFRYIAGPIELAQPTPEGLEIIWGLYRDGMALYTQTQKLDPAAMRFDGWSDYDPKSGRMTIGFDAGEGQNPRHLKVEMRLDPKLFERNGKILISQAEVVGILDARHELRVGLEPGMPVPDKKPGRRVILKVIGSGVLRALLPSISSASDTIPVMNINPIFALQFQEDFLKALYDYLRKLGLPGYVSFSMFRSYFTETNAFQATRNLLLQAMDEIKNRPELQPFSGLLKQIDTLLITQYELPSAFSGRGEWNGKNIGAVVISPHLFLNAKDEASRLHTAIFFLLQEAKSLELAGDKVFNANSVSTPEFKQARIAMCRFNAELEKALGVAWDEYERWDYLASVLESGDTRHPVYQFLMEKGKTFEADDVANLWYSALGVMNRFAANNDINEFHFDGISMRENNVISIGFKTQSENFEVTLVLDPKRYQRKKIQILKTAVVPHTTSTVSLPTKRMEHREMSQALWTNAQNPLSSPRVEAILARYLAPRETGIPSPMLPELAEALAEESLSSADLREELDHTVNEAVGQMANYFWIHPKSIQPLMNRWKALAKSVVEGKQDIVILPDESNQASMMQAIESCQGLISRVVVVSGNPEILLQWVTGLKELCVTPFKKIKGLLKERLPEGQTAMPVIGKQNRIPLGALNAYHFYVGVDTDVQIDDPHMDLPESLLQVVSGLIVAEQLKDKKRSVEEIQKEVLKKLFSAYAYAGDILLFQQKEGRLQIFVSRSGLHQYLLDVTSARLVQTAA